MTRLIAIDPEYPDPTLLAAAGAVIQQGGLVAFPTETVYGLGADALNDTAVSRIFAAKERPFHDPIIVHIAAVADLPRIARSIPEIAWQLADQFWPGPLTLVLPRHTAVPDSITANGPTVAVRCPDHPLALALLQAAGTPIGAPSANRFSHTSPTTAQHVLADLDGRIDLILDGGPTPIGVESTVLDLTGVANGAPPRLLRPGGVTVEVLTAVLGPIDLVSRQGQRSNATLPSPGLLDRHYAPRSELRLFVGEDEVVRLAMQQAARSIMATGQRVALLLANEDSPYFAADTFPDRALVGSLADPGSVARNLFRVLRELDEKRPFLILARDFPPQGLGLAIQDRLRRAAARIIRC